MTDLERAMKFLDCHAEAAGPLVQLLETARREGAEKMREQAAQYAFDRTSDEPLPGDWNEACEHIADAIRALPLTPEEPPTKDSTPNPQSPAAAPQG